MTPYKARTGTKLELKHLWIIGTIGFAMDQKPQTSQKKFQSQSTLCTLVEYKSNHIYQMLDLTKKVIRVFNVKWNKEKRPADITPENEPCPKQVCMQESNQPKTSSPGKKISNSTSFHLSDPTSTFSESVIVAEESTTQHLYATRSKTLSNLLDSMAYFANTKDVDTVEPRTYDEAAKCFEWKK